MDVVFASTFAGAEQVVVFRCKQGLIEALKFSADKSVDVC